MNETIEKRYAGGNGLLAGYVTRAQLAGEWNCHERTIARYELEPDGLPCLCIAGRKLYRIEDARAFMDRRITKPNPVRKSA